MTHCLPTRRSAERLTVSGGSNRTAGIVHVNGTTQTVTLSDALAASAVDGTAFGIVLGGGADVATVHLPSTLTATSLEGDASGLLAANGAGLVIAGNGSVTASAGRKAVGSSNNAQERKCVG